MARVWIDLGDAGWGDVRVVRARLERIGYTTAEVRGVARVWVRVSGSRLESEALWEMPP